MEEPMRQVTRPASAEEIIEILGRLEDALLMRIVATGATPAEVLEGFTWAMADDRVAAELHRRPRGAAAAVYDILKQEEPEPDELA
jgi:hypothetical protein